MLDSDGILDGRSLARTYDGGYYDDAAEIAEQYFDVIEYQSRHPNKGSQAISTALELPRSRIRTWTDGGSPDSARGIETARDYGWLEAGFDDPEFAGLNALVANVFSGGSIAADTYQPSFALNHRGEESHVFDALELAGADYQVVDGRPGKADEVRPTENGTVLGRVLEVLGAPVGPKADQRLELPDYLEVAPDDARDLFVACYLENRAAEYDDKATLRVMEDRNREYLDNLADLIADVADGRVTTDDRGVTISADAARNLGVVR